MTDDQFIHALEHGELAPAEFNHRAHLRAAYIYLQRANWLDATVRMRDTLRVFAARIGKAGLYHETITVAFMALVAERAAHGSYADGAAFAEAHGDLADKQLLNRWYTATRLGSEQARARFVMPDCTQAVLP